MQENQKLSHTPLEKRKQGSCCRHVCVCVSTTHPSFSIDKAASARNINRSRCYYALLFCYYGQKLSGILISYHFLLHLTHNRHRQLVTSASPSRKMSPGKVHRKRKHSVSVKNRFSFTFLSHINFSPFLFHGHLRIHRVCGWCTSTNIINLPK